MDMGGCQNYGPILGTLNIRCRIRIGIQKGTIILTTTHMWCLQGFPKGRIEIVLSQFLFVIARCEPAVSRPCGDAI